MIDIRQLVFYAPNTVTIGMRQSVLTTYYTLAVTKEKLPATFLIIGRVFTAPIDSTDGGIKFTSTDFNYTVSLRKNGGWNITIQPKDTQAAREMNLIVFDNGAASLQVNSNNRQSISFNGTVKKVVLK